MPMTAVEVTVALSTAVHLFLSGGAVSALEFVLVDGTARSSQRNFDNWLRRETPGVGRHTGAHSNCSVTGLMGWNRGVYQCKGIIGVRFDVRIIDPPVENSAVHLGEIDPEWFRPLRHFADYSPKQIRIAQTCDIRQ
jgi:signal peptidase I